MGRLIVLLASFVVWPILALAQTTLTPNVILNRISENGALATLMQIYENENEWGKFLSNIGNGNAAWLKVAVALQPSSDGGISEELNLYVGEALEHNPRSVLLVAAPVFSILNICIGPDIDDRRYNSYTLALKVIEKRKKMLRTVSDQNLITIRDECIKQLDHSKSFYEYEK